VEYLNLKMQEIKDQGKINGLDRIAIMAALNISHEFLTTRFGNFEVSEFKRRMANIEATLDQALVDQEKLF
jgi:cell division protein ZapA